jgi:hypothetical protein
MIDLLFDPSYQYKRTAGTKLADIRAFKPSPTHVPPELAHNVP